MSDGQFYQKGSDDIVKGKTELAAVEDALLDAFQRWEQLENAGGETLDTV